MRRRLRQHHYLEHMCYSRPMSEEHQVRTVADGGLTSTPLGSRRPDLRPPEHNRVCWAASIGGARRLMPQEGWAAVEVLAAERLRDGSQACICAKRKGQHRGRRQR